LDDQHVLGALFDSSDEIGLVTLYPGGVIDTKFKYTREVDILLMWLSDEPSNLAEEANGAIILFTKDGNPVLIGIQGAREFILG
jgi:hypothetical protein